MISRQSHPFIVNTLESSGKWSLDVSYFRSADTWAVSTVFDDDRCHESTTVETGSTIPEALDRLESVLSGRESALSGSGAELAGREYVTKPDPEREAYLARWKDAPEWAQWLAEYPNRLGRWFEVKPSQEVDGLWLVLQSPAGKDAFAGYNLLGSVRCEPRPEL